MRSRPSLFGVIAFAILVSPFAVQAASDCQFECVPPSGDCSAPGLPAEEFNSRLFPDVNSACQPVSAQPANSNPTSGPSSSWAYVTFACGTQHIYWSCSASACMQSTSPCKVPTGQTYTQSVLVMAAKLHGQTLIALPTSTLDYTYAFDSTPLVDVWDHTYIGYHTGKFGSDARGNCTCVLDGGTEWDEAPTGSPVLRASGIKPTLVWKNPSSGTLTVSSSGTSAVFHIGTVGTYKIGPTYTVPSTYLYQDPNYPQASVSGSAAITVTIKGSTATPTPIPGPTVSPSPTSSPSSIPAS